MAWVQAGTHKINTDLINYVQVEEDGVRIFFGSNVKPLELHFDEAKAFWRYLKAEDLMAARDKGSSAVLPKMRSSSMYSVEGHAAEERSRPVVTAAVSGTAAPRPAHSHHSSQNHQPTQPRQSQPHLHRPAEQRKP